MAAQAAADAAAAASAAETGAPAPSLLRIASRCARGHKEADNIGLVALFRAADFLSRGVRGALGPMASLMSGSHPSHELASLWLACAKDAWFGARQAGLAAGDEFPPEAVLVLERRRLLREAATAAERAAAVISVDLLTKAKRLGRHRQEEVSSAARPAELPLAAVVGAEAEALRREDLQLYAAVVCVGRWGLLRKLAREAERAEAAARAALEGERAAAAGTIAWLSQVEARGASSAA